VFSDAVQLGVGTVMRLTASRDISRFFEDASGGAPSGQTVTSAAPVKVLSHRSVPLDPFRAGAAHVMQLRPVTRRDEPAHYSPNKP
jgi:hypothetical protein